MQVSLSAAVEVSEKYAANVRAAFDEFLDGLPDRIANVVVTKEPSDGEQAESQPSAQGDGVTTEAPRRRGR